jgi:hypothetical protein
LKNSFSDALSTRLMSSRYRPLTVAAKFPQWFRMVGLSLAGLE